MTTFTGKINLLRLKNSCIVTVKGKSATKKGVFIPIEDNNLFISADDDLKPRGAYIDFTAWENREPGKYGDTHSIRQSLPKEVRERMTDEELRAVPYFGNMKPFTIENAAKEVEAPVAQMTGQDDDLPF